MNRIALITGGSRGLGKDMALRLAQSGCDVIITYRSKLEEANNVVSQIEQTGKTAASLQFDVGKISTFDSFVRELQTLLKNKFNAEKIDILINNAGVGATIPINQVTEDDFDNLINIHFKGVYFLTQKLLPYLNDQGHIINISSGTTRFANPGYSVYASAKSAIETFTRYLAKEVGARGITANVLAPGAIETDFNEAAIRNNPQVKGYIASQTALGRVGQAEDIGGIVAFLCSPDGRVTLVAPTSTRLDVARAYAISKLGWIREQQRQFINQTRETSRQFVERESHYLWGRRYLLSVVYRDFKPIVTPGSTGIRYRPRTGTSAGTNT